MPRTTISARLRERLGEDASEDLALAIDGAKGDMIAICQEKFEARLTGVASELRQELTRVDANQRVTMTDGFSAVRKEMADGFSAVRKEMSDGFSAVRKEMSDGFSALRKEMSEMRVDMIRASFLFWLGQFAALVVALNYMLRGLR
jgi:triphosphoribosyl-dephospho-CoA synthetase